MAAQKQILLITGGNTGLGYETCLSLYKSPHSYEIIMGSRTASKARDAIAKIHAAVPDSKSTLSDVAIDIESDDSIAACYKTVESKFGRVDILINNAGGSFDIENKEGRMTRRQMWNKTWDVNVAGTDLMTETFVPLLLKSSSPRILFIASGTSSLANTQDPKIPIDFKPEAGWPKPPQASWVTAYRSAKCGMNMLMREWNRLLGNDGVKVFACSPGMLATGLGGVGPERLRQMGAIEPEVGANFLRDVVEGKRDDDAGLVIGRNGVQPF